MMQSGTSSDAPRPSRLNPFQKTGTDSPYELKETEESFIMRIDMPGCPEKSLAHWVDASNLNFYADELPNAKIDHCGRRYAGCMEINRERYNIRETKFELVNGILWITVPKHAKKVST